MLLCFHRFNISWFFHFRNRDLSQWNKQQYRPLPPTVFWYILTFTPLITIYLCLCFAKIIAWQRRLAVENRLLQISCSYSVQHWNAKSSFLNNVKRKKFFHLQVAQLIKNLTKYFLYPPRSKPENIYQWECKWSWMLWKQNTCANDDVRTKNVIFVSGRTYRYLYKIYFSIYKLGLNKPHVPKVDSWCLQ